MAGAVVGYGLAHVLPSDETWVADTWVTGARIGEIESLSVLPGYRGAGIGSALLEGLERALERAGIDDLVLGVLPGNTAAMRLYERRGYRPTWMYLSRSPDEIELTGRYPTDRLVLLMASSPDLRPAPARERLMRAAADLFYAEGYGVSIESIAERAGVAKPTVYAHFASKEALIAAVLEAATDQWFEELDAEVAHRAGNPVSQIMAPFDLLVEDLPDPAYRGCVFVNSAAAFPDPAHPARQVLAAHHERMLERFEVLAAAAGASRPGPWRGHCSCCTTASRSAGSSMSPVRPPTTPGKPLGRS